MAQSSISSYYRSTRKRAGEDEAVAAKRRKTVPQDQQSLCPFIQPEEPDTRPRRATRASAAKAKRTAASRRPRRKAKPTQGPSIHSLLAGMREDATAQQKQTVPVPSSLKAVPAPSPVKAVPAPSPVKAVPAPSPVKAVPAPSPVKAVPAPSPVKAVPAPSPVKAVPAPSPLKAVPAPSPLKLASTPSPLRTAVSTRSSLMVQMAKERQSSKDRQAAVKRGVCRRLLAEPGQGAESPRTVTAADLRELRSMSVRELAQPTSVEKSRLRPEAAQPTSVEKSRLRPEVAQPTSVQKSRLRPEVAQPTSVEKSRLRPEAAGGTSPQIKSFSAFHVESPSKPSSPRRPAYRRHQSLVAGEVLELPLPQKYLLLAEKFRCVDMVTNMLQKRGEVCTLRKLKEAVEEMLKRAFAEQNLGQMKRVYPGAFLFRRENHIPGNYDREVFEQYQLTVECNAEETGAGSLKPCVSSCGSYRFLCPQALLQRRKTFRAGLEQVTRQHHKEYLRQLGIEVADPELKRWHPDFPLHEVDDVPASPLPAAPKGEKLVSAQEVLARLQDKMGVGVEGTVPPVAPAPAPENGALKGVSVNLIEKVRQREAQLMRRHLVRCSETQQKLDMLARMGSLCRILNSHFVTSKKAALPLDEVLQKLSESHSSELAKDSLEAHLALLVEVMGRWVQRVQIRGKTYIKRVDKTMDMKTLADIIKHKETELHRV